LNGIESQKKKVLKYTHLIYYVLGIVALGIVTEVAVNFFQCYVGYVNLYSACHEILELSN